jgi:hypothetical protein
MLAFGKMDARCLAPMIGVLGSPVLPMTRTGGAPEGWRSVTGWRPDGHETQPPIV